MKTYQEIKKEYTQKYPVEYEEEKTEYGFNLEYLEEQYQDYLGDCECDGVEPEPINTYEQKLYEYWSSSIFP